MIDFKKHSLKNFNDVQIDSWIQRGLKNVANMMNIDKDELERIINVQETEIAERKKRPTINDNSLERIYLRDKILRDYQELYQNARQDKKAVIVLGQIASGKSSLCKVLENSGENVIVDVDFIKQGHGSMAGLRFDFDDGLGTDMIHEEASMLSKRFLDNMSTFGYNLVIPKAGTNYSSIEKIARKLKTKGYEVQICYIDLPIEKCVERNYYRFVDESRNRVPSRLVPFNIIAMIDDNPFKTFTKFLLNHSPYIDSYYAYSNDVSMGEEMVPIDLNEIIEYCNAQEKEELE